MRYMVSTPDRRASWIRAVVVVEVAGAVALLGAVGGPTALAVALPVAAALVAGTLSRPGGIPAYRWVLLPFRPIRVPPPDPGRLAARLGRWAGPLNASSTMDGVGVLRDHDGCVLVLALGTDPSSRLCGPGDGGTAVVLASIGGPSVRRAQLLLATGDGSATDALVALRCDEDAAPRVLRRAVRELDRRGLAGTPIPADRIASLLASWARPAPPSVVDGVGWHRMRLGGWHQRCLTLRPTGRRPARGASGGTARHTTGGARASRDQVATAPVAAVWTALRDRRTAATLAISLDRAPAARTGGAGPGPVADPAPGSERPRPPAPACALTVRLIARRPGELAIAERALREAVGATGVRVEAPAGEQWSGLAATLPLAAAVDPAWACPAAPGGRAAGATTAAADRAVRIVPGGAPVQVVLGTDRAGQAYRLPLFGPVPTRISLVGDRSLAMALASTAAAQGVTVRVHTDRPASWPAPRRRSPGDAGPPPPEPPTVRPDPRTPLLLVTDSPVQPPLGPGQCLLTVHTDIPPSRQTAGTVLIGRLPVDRAEAVADALGLGAARHWLVRIPGDTLAVVGAGGVHWIRLDTGSGAMAGRRARDHRW